MAKLDRAMQTAKRMTAVPSLHTRAASRVEQVAAVVEIAGWGWLPALSLVAACGVLLVAFAFNGAREGAPWSELLHQAGLLVLFVPIAVRLFDRSAARQERIGLLLALGLGLYLVKVMYSPLEFKFSDELQHWRSTEDLLQSGRLFQFNYALPASPVYPSLQNNTSALSSLSGLPIFETGVIIIGAARLVFVVALFLFYERIIQSAHVAGIASMIYMTNPHYQFLNAMFTYQALALPLMALMLFTIARRAYTHPGDRAGLQIALSLGLTAVVITHHITSYLLLLFITLWMAAYKWTKISPRVMRYVRETAFWRFLHRLLGRFTWLGKDSGEYISRESCDSNPAGIALLAVVLILTWIAYVAMVTIDYLRKPLSTALNELISLTTREASVSETFQAPSRPVYEQWLSYSAVGLIVVGLLLGIWYVWRYYRHNALALAMALSSLGYFGGIALRLFASQGQELAGRSFPFTYLPAGFMLGLGMVEISRPQRRKWMLRIVFPALSIILFLGGMASGWPPFWGRLPGSFLVEASERSVDPQGVAAAKWARVALGTRNRIASNFTNYILMGTYGAQDPVFGLAAVFFAPRLGREEIEDIRWNAIRYLVVDKRLSSMQPVRGFYFEGWENNGHNYTYPIEPAFLSKFDGRNDISRIFDSGDIIIYDVGALSHAQ